MKARKITAKANAKVNLTFEVNDVMADGYHEVSTLLQSVDLKDKVLVEVSPSEKGRIYISSYQANVAGEFPMDESNLAYKACDLFLNHIEESGNFEVKIKIEKKIPIQAGLAGGSANAAASLVAMNEAFDNRLNKEEILTLAESLGADVPFAVTGGTCIGTNRGDKLESIKNQTKLYMILVKPRYLSISTPMLFKLYDKYVREKAEKAESLDASKKETLILSDYYEINRTSQEGRNTELASLALKNFDLEKFFQNLTNHFEDVVFSLHPELESLRDKLLELGCWTANLTGSGPTIYGTTPDIEKANLIQRKLIADKLNNPQSAYYKHGPLDHWVVVSSGDSAKVIT